MEVCCVTSFVRWARRASPEMADLTLTMFFRSCYFFAWNKMLPDTQLQNDLAEFAKGKVPSYVIHTMRKHLYQSICYTNPEPTPPLIV